MHMHRAKYVPNGGPDGGDGGRGGHIYLRGNRNYWTLLHLRYDRHIFAGHGGNGGKNGSHGADGADRYIDVPCGTVVYDADTGRFVCDVTEDGQTVMLLRGGRGGLGNKHFATATNQAPRFAQPGEPMQELTVIMELKMLADVGLVGFPNAGKSTLLNALVGEERAIVTDIPGTTRDTIEEVINLDGILFRFIDTAGIRESQDAVENLGIERSFRKMAEAEIVLGMLDGTAQPEELAAQLALLGQHLTGSSQKLILLLNKADLVENWAHNKNVLIINKFVLLRDSKVDVIELSAKNGQGLDQLKSTLVSLEKDLISGQNATFVTNVRHYDALRQASSALLDCRTSLSRGIPSDLVAEDLRRALSAINAILGTDLLDPELILHSIFKNHCIGK